jgi:3-oxoisoapionate decarboxylase
MTPLALLDQAVELGVSVVQIADRIALHELNEAELTTLREQAAARGITLEIGTWGINADRLRRYVDIARTLGAPLIRTVIETEPRQPTAREAVQTLASIAPLLEQRGVSLAIENHERLNARTLRQIIDEVGSARVGVCLDTANSLGCSEGSEHVLEVLGPRTYCLHIKDYTARRLPHRFGFMIEGCAAGTGDLDIPHWLARLREMRREVNVILELWPAPESTIADSIEKETRWAAESVRYLRQFIPE